MTNILITGYGSIGKKHLENFQQFKNIHLTVYTKRNDLQSLKKEGKLMKTINVS
jgi:lactate dehydrogenase-like 2-hydroxyacid dehydrogenase|tara:strand:+ start:169 stop:330 length:162 start_codon:yes stop_codon:yes gene_type:complete